jgi:hypothetical protein
MFPLQFPLGILLRDRMWQPPGVVFDPFCGRGTTNFASRLVGVDTIGMDCNSVAAAITAAKLISAKPLDIIEEAERILASVRIGPQPAGEFWELAYDGEVLNQLCILREDLLRDCSTPARVALRAIILGAMHGPQRRSGSSYFSNQSPRTYSPKPRYAVNFWKTRGLRPPKVDVLATISKQRIVTIITRFPR